MKSVGFLVLVMIVFMGLLTRPLEAGAAPDSVDYYSNDPVTKLVRGIANVIESPVELGCQTREPSYENPWSATGHFLNGFVMMGRRAILGVIDIATFMFPGDSNLHPVCSHSKYYANPI